ncbi:MAG: hypothetical protein JW785_08320, partial [Acidimicrobiia bacterium]|nr:hypothetical protein [Acidimicrobiia bacterium]
AGEIPLDWISDSWGGLGYRLELGVYLPERVEIALLQGDVVIAGIPVPGGEYDYRLGGRKPTVIDDQPFAKWTLGLDYTFGSHFYVNLMWVHGLSDEFGAGDFLSGGYAVRGSRLESDDPLNCLLDRMFGHGEDQATASRYCGDRGAVETLRPRIGDYAVVIVDFKFDDDKALLRLFAMWDVSGYFEDRWNEALGQRESKYLSLFGSGFSGILYPEFKYNFGNGLELGLGALLQFGKGYTKFGDPAAGGSLLWTRARFSW